MPSKQPADDVSVISLESILSAFNVPLSVDVAWALCYQCAKLFNSALQKDREKYLVTEQKHVLIQSDGNIHPKTIFGDPNDGTRSPVKSDGALVKSLGHIICKALIYNKDSVEDLDIDQQLEELLWYMTEIEEEPSDQDRLDSNDDEGIERDSGESYNGENAGPSSFTIYPSSRAFEKILKLCVDRIGPEAEIHYKNVCRALVAEALELKSFLQTVVSPGINNRRNDFLARTDSSSCSDLGKLQTMDWSRFWVQVIGELRMGVKLKKVDCSRTPIEYELTPYEILMDDIRSRRFKLRKVMIDGDIPRKVKQDAHAVILDFIRARPPLRKVADRKLAPLVRQPTPREALLDSIKRGRKLRPTSRQKTNLIADQSQEEPLKYLNETNSDKPMRRLLKPDFSVLESDDDEDEDEADSSLEDSHHQNGLLDSTQVYPKAQISPNPWRRTAYDLATQCPSRRASMRRHTVVACGPEFPALPPQQCHSVPQSQPTSRPGSRLSHTSTDTDHLGTTIPEMSWSRTSLQDEFIQSKNWQDLSLDDRLSLTLEEIVHIRSVLTKAELEGLPVEGHVKEDVEKRKICFLCLKTRFGIFGPWGQRCKLCKRTVCSKCHSKMRIPTEHFSNVPVVLLSPTLMSSPEEELNNSFPRSLVNRLIVPEQQNTIRNSVGSAPSSPNFQRNNTVDLNGSSSSTPGSRIDSRMTSSMEGPVSLPAESPASTISERRARIARAKTLGRPDEKTSDRLKGMQMIVCADCKTMVIQIIKSSRSNRTQLRNNAIRNLTLNLSPVY